MSLSPSFPQGAPTLAEVLLQRTFAKPPTPFVDGELTKALATADTPPVTVAIQASKESGSSSPDSHDSESDPASDASARSSDDDGTSRSVDVRV
jgi:hypothetical protein